MREEEHVISIPILILAGGSSSRMGSKDKLLEPVDGQPLIRLQAWRALKASRDVTVLVRPSQTKLKDALQGLQLRILVANEALEGMGGSLRAGTRNMINRECFMLVLADLVELDTRDLREVLNARTAEDNALILRGATEDGKPGHPILFENGVYKDLLNLHGDSGGKSVLQKHENKIKLVPLPGQRARQDLDTPEAWTQWREKRDYFRTG